MSADTEALVDREVRVASGLLPELVSIVSDYAFGARFYILRSDDSFVDDAQRATFLANPLRTQSGGFEPTRVHLLEHSRTRHGGKWRPMEKRMVVNGILATNWVYDPPQLLHIESKLYIIAPIHVYNASNAKEQTDIQTSIYSFDPFTHFNPHEPVVKLAETLLVNASSSPCYVGAIRSIVWAGGFASDRVTSYNIDSNKWAFQGFGRYDSLICSGVFDSDTPWLPRLPTARHSCGIASLGNTLYLTSGTEGNNHYSLGHGLQLDLSKPDLKWTTFQCPFVGGCTAYPWDSNRFVAITWLVNPAGVMSYYVFDTSDSDASGQWTNLPSPTLPLTTLYSLDGKLHANMATSTSVTRSTVGSILVSFDEQTRKWRPVEIDTAETPLITTATTPTSLELALVNVHSFVVIY